MFGRKHVNRPSRRRLDLVVLWAYGHDIISFYQHSLKYISCFPECALSGELVPRQCPADLIFDGVRCEWRRNVEGCNAPVSGMKIPGTCAT